MFSNPIIIFTVFDDTCEKDFTSVYPFQSIQNVWQNGLKTTFKLYYGFYFKKINLNLKYSCVHIKLY
jgi:hypothetical protein